MSILEAKSLELYKISLDNVGSQPEIAAIMSQFGYGPDTIVQGRSLLDQARLVYDRNKTEGDESSAAYHVFSSKKDQLSELYSLDRKKAKVAFRKDPVTMERLGLNGSITKAHTRWIEMVRRFYSLILADTAIQSQMARLNVSIEHLTAANALLVEVEGARGTYLKEQGESQDATHNKNSVFDQLEDWMKEFYAVAKIALEDRPQLAESLGKLVRN